MSVRVSQNSPELVFEIDFDTEPTATPRTYTDVSADVRQLSYTRSGRTHELQRTEPGTLSGVLNNRHGDYDSGNTSGSYYPGVKRMRWCRVSAVWATVTYRRWTGLIETWRQEWPGSGKDAIVTIASVDAMKVLNLYDLDGQSYASALTSVRAGAIFGAAGLTGWTSSTGQTTLVAAGPFAAGSSALAHLMEVEESENGLLFAAGDGSMVFQDRHYRLNNSATSKGTIGDLPGDIRYSMGHLDLDDVNLWNDVEVTPSGGTAEVADHAGSKLDYFTRRLNRSILTSSQSEALSCAQFLTQRYGENTSRIPAVEIVGARDTTKWPVILAAVNSDRFVWRRTTEARTIEQDVYVERVSDQVTPGSDWRVSFELSPAIDQAGWVAGDATFSLAGTSTRAVY